MSILSLASYNSQFRGYDYYENKKVLQTEQLSETTYHGLVAGNGREPYDVTIDLVHPRKSTCTCPHAAGRCVICKHMVALYFAVFPEEAEAFLQQVEEAQEEAEPMQEAIAEHLEQTIRKMKKAELQDALMDLLSHCPDWQYEQFIRTYVNLDDFYE